MITHKTKIVVIGATLYLIMSAVLLAGVTYAVIVVGKKLEDRIIAIAEKDARVRAHTSLQKLMEETREDREELSTYILTEDQTSTFLTNIESLGSEVGVELTTGSLEVVKKEGLFNELLIQFKIEGDESSVMKMHLLFETLPYRSKIAALSLSRAEGGRTESTLQIAVTLLKHDQ